jgi:glycosyltransferase involved in cell wall biosynthesis
VPTRVQRVPTSIAVRRVSPTVLESFRAGVPVVRYDVGGVSEIVTDVETGYLVGRGQFEQFVSRVDLLLSDEETLERGDGAEVFTKKR